ncbi:MAG: hypothetical protein R2836_03530 [Chitinophagales bacterium]
MRIESYFTKQTDVRKIILEHLDSVSSKVFAVVNGLQIQNYLKLIELQEKGRFNRMLL